MHVFTLRLVLIFETPRPPSPGGTLEWLEVEQSEFLRACLSEIKVTTCPGHHKSLLQKVIMVHDHASLAATSSHAESTPERLPPVRMSTLPRLFEPFVFSHGGFS